MREKLEKEMREMRNEKLQKELKDKKKKINKQPATNNFEKIITKN